MLTISFLEITFIIRAMSLAKAIQTLFLYRRKKAGELWEATPPADGKSSKHSVGLRLNLFFFGTFFIFCIIIVRLAGLQFTEGALLTEEEIKRDTKFVPLAAMRGIIFAAGVSR